MNKLQIAAKELGEAEEDQRKLAELIGNNSIDASSAASRYKDNQKTIATANRVIASALANAKEIIETIGVQKIAELDPTFMEMVVAYLQPQRKYTKLSEKNTDELRDKIKHLVDAGFRNSDIARLLDISLHVVREHAPRRRIIMIGPGGVSIDVNKVGRPPAWVTNAYNSGSPAVKVEYI